MERGIRRLRSSADDGGRDPHRRRRISSNALNGCGRKRPRRGISRATYDAQTRGLTPDLKIMDLVDAQPEFTKAFWDYLDLLVSEDRIARGREMLAQNRADVRCDGAQLRRRPPCHHRDLGHRIEILHHDRRPLGGALDRDAGLCRPPAGLFPQRISRDARIAHIAATSRRIDAKGSWAGAFGPTQFMPTVYKTYAIDADGDGRRDVIASVPDLLASTANYFRKHGWETGQTWGYEVVVPKNFNFLLADRSKVMTIHEWERLGIRARGRQAVSARQRPRLPDGAGRLAGAGLPDAE